MKKTLSLLLCLCALFALLSACSPAFKDDARIGEYTALADDGKGVQYRLVLNENGEGTLTHYSTIGPEETEDVIFTIDGDRLLVHGTERVGGVIGRNEFEGVFILEGDAYTVTLRSAQSGVALAYSPFTQVK
ncbi:MAG: hypothetical protein IJV96_01320 [Clostridia bacterium]|nr:hypothetical protein [Clostridia bacterium]